MMTDRNRACGMAGSRHTTPQADAMPETQSRGGASSQAHDCVTTVRANVSQALPHGCCRTGKVAIGKPRRRPTVTLVQEGYCRWMTRDELPKSSKHVSSMCVCAADAELVVAA